jgi:hypothetical protein
MRKPLVMYDFEPDHHDGCIYNSYAVAVVQLLTRTADCVHKGSAIQYMCTEKCKT